jgi:hypothetical protein
MYPDPLLDGGEKWLVYDWDQRRCVDVQFPKHVDKPFVLVAVDKFMDTLPAGVVKVDVSEDGSLASTSSDAAHDRFFIPFYPPRTEFPRRVPTIRRRDLTEIDRLGVQVDLVSYSPRPGETRKVVFKYYWTHHNVPIWWHEANCVMRMPRHPNIVPFDALVVDTIDRVDRVVGFTARYVPGETLDENKDRVFKLKYLEQLISVSISPLPFITIPTLETDPASQTVDHLNLTLGIVHGDITPWNLLVDAESDTIQLFDFNQAAKLGWEGDAENQFKFGYDKHRNDVSFVIFTAYELITHRFIRQESYLEDLDASQILRKRKWVKHRNAKLDNPPEEYQRVLREWVKRRTKSDKVVNHFTKASQPLSWPPLCVDEFMAQDHSPFKRRGRLRCVLMELGREYLTWERPPTKAMPLPAGQRLLATGEVVEDSDGVGGSGK